MREQLSARLRALEDQGLRRSPLLLSGPVGPEARVDGRPVINLSSNDYLGLAAHPALAEAAALAGGDLGSGAGAARLVTGSLELHQELERRLAEVLRCERALLFGSGYLANVGTIPALMNAAEDVIYSDERNHASIVDGCRLSRARVRVYRHRDAEHLEHLLAADAGSGGHRLVITETVFSMDGDVAPLSRLCRLAEGYNAWILVDEAHAFGVRGPRGAGVVAERGLEGRVQVRMGTLGKAAGCYGAFVGGSDELVSYLVSCARTFIYSTALPPPVVSAALAALELIQGQEGAVRRRALARAGSVLREGLASQGWPLLDNPGPIVPLHVGDPLRAVALAEELLVEDVLVRAMRHPTVPRGTERLRLVASAAHDAVHLERALAAFGRVFERRER